MTSIFGDQTFNREISFCRVYSVDSKDKLEKLFLKNQISYFIEWQEPSFFAKLFGGDKQKSNFTVRINEADVERATKLVHGLEAVRLKKIKEDS